MHLWNISK